MVKISVYMYLFYTIIIIQFFIFLFIYFYLTLSSIILLSFISFQIYIHDFLFLFIVVDEGFGPIYTLILVQAGLISRFLNQSTTQEGCNVEHKLIIYSTITYLPPKFVQQLCSITGPSMTTASGFRGH